MARNNTKRKASGKKVYSIIVDGETEVWYLQLMKRYRSLTNLNIEPELPKRKKLVDLFELVKANAKIYTKVIWIIDFDAVVKENNEVRRGEKSVFKTLEDYIVKLKKLGNVEVLINTPCLEFWYLLHFKETGKYYASSDKICKLFKGTILEDYEKSERYYKKRNNDIYLKLQGLQPVAIANAEKLGDFDFGNPETAISEIYKIFNLI